MSHSERIIWIILVVEFQPGSILLFSLYYATQPFYVQLDITIPVFTDSETKVGRER